MSNDRYGLLHYRRDITSSVREGQILGCDEVGRPYAVLDAEYEPQTDMTTVHLAYATAEQIKAAQA